MIVELSERDYLLFLFFIQDIAHADGGYPPVGMSRTLALSLAGFQLITIGRFWVITEGPHMVSARPGNLCRRPEHMRPRAAHECGD
jgi:hypothetical protein